MGNDLWAEFPAQIAQDGEGQVPPAPAARLVVEPIDDSLYRPLPVSVGPGPGAQRVALGEQGTSELEV